MEEKRISESVKTDPAFRLTFVRAWQAAESMSDMLKKIGRWTANADKNDAGIKDASQAAAWLRSVLPPDATLKKMPHKRGRSLDTGSMDDVIALLKKGPEPLPAPKQDIPRAIEPEPLPAPKQDIPSAIEPAKKARK